MVIVQAVIMLPSSESGQSCQHAFLSDEADASGEGWAMSPMSYKVSMAKGKHKSIVPNFRFSVLAIVSLSSKPMSI